MNADGLTLVVVTHDPLIGARARRRVRLADGVVVSDDSGGPHPGSAVVGDPAP
jgi:putative ABC transport system ATP-binding protein